MYSLLLAWSFFHVQLLPPTISLLPYYLLQLLYESLGWNLASGGMSDGRLQPEINTNQQRAMALPPTISLLNTEYLL